MPLENFFLGSLSEEISHVLSLINEVSTKFLNAQLEISGTNGPILKIYFLFESFKLNPEAS